MKRFIAFAVALSMILALVSVPVSAETASAAIRHRDASGMNASFKAYAPESVTAGEEFPVVVEVNGEYEAHTLKLMLDFDPEKVEHVSTAYGTITTQAVANGGFPMSAVATSGKSLSFGLIMPTAPFTGSGELYTATFRAKQDLVYNEYGFRLHIDSPSDFAYFPSGGTSSPIQDHSEEVLIENPARHFSAEIFVESPEKAHPGDDIEVTLNISGEYQMTGIQIYLYFDAEAFEITEYVPGAVLEAAEAAGGYCIESHTANPGEVSLIVLIPDADISDEGVIYTLNLHVADDAEPGVYDFGPELARMVYSEPGSTSVYDIENVTVEGSETEIVEVFTVTWLNWDGTELEVDEGVEAGTMPTYDGEEPTKGGDDQYTYTFIGWDPEVSEVTGDITYTAVFEETVNTYTVTWVNEDGTELEVDEEVEYGTMPTYDGEEPIKEGDAQYSYTFIGWDPEVSEVTGDITYTAVFEEVVNTYTVTWVNWDETELEVDEEVEYGTMPTYDGEEPTKEGDAQYTYTFIGWDPEVSEVTGDITYTAVFEQTVNTYTVTWV
ncbi:MAG: hypothetical protein IKI64_06255, partial [Clostridia bacterium]|nr:hypothetical protein [Clostridia bacterium]